MTAIFRYLVTSFVAVSGLSFGQTVTAWVASSRFGNEARFLFDSSVQRYDLAAKEWLPAYTLSRSGPTAMDEDSDGTVLVYGSQIYRGATDFSGLSLLATASSQIESVHLDGNLVIAVHSSGLYGRISIFDRSSGATLSYKETYPMPTYGASLAKQHNRLYGGTRNLSPGKVLLSSYTDAGVIGSPRGSDYYGSLPEARRTWVSPDESLVFDSAGAVYEADLSYRTSLNAPIRDIVFDGKQTVVLSSDRLLAFDSGMQLAGQRQAGSANLNLFVNGEELFIFSPGYSYSTPFVSTVELSSIEKVDPKRLAYQVDAVFTASNSDLLLFSKEQKSIFRWSPQSGTYTASFRLQGTPSYAVYSAERNTLYLAYDSGEIHSLNLAADSPQETAFAVNQQPVKGLATAGEFVIASGGQGSWATHNVFGPDGQLLDTEDWNYNSSSWAWNPALRRLYFLRGDVNPNGLIYEGIDELGKISISGDTPYYGNLSFDGPIRVSPDGTKVAIGSGRIFDAATLEKTATLPNSFADALWRDESLVTLREKDGASEIQVWQGVNFVQTPLTRVLNGTPLAITAQGNGYLVTTSIDGAPRFALLDVGLNVLSVSAFPPVSPSGLMMTNRTDTSVDISWQDRSDNESGFRIEYRTPTQQFWTAGPSVAANQQMAHLEGLWQGQPYLIRVIATLAGLDSDPSPPLSFSTLTSTRVPLGEPYLLKAPQVFASRVSLQWQDNSSNETGFDIFRSLSSEGGYSRLLTTAPNTTGYVDQSVSPGTTYYYRIQAVNGFYIGDLSAPLQVTTPKGNYAPTAADGVVLSSSAPGVMIVNWVDESTDEDQFIVQRRIAGDANPWIEVGRVGYNVTTYTDTTVIPGTAYEYRVVAINSYGFRTSWFSNGLATPKVGGDFTGLAAKGTNIYYLVFNGPDRIERYDLNAREWLQPIYLPGTPTAFWVDSSGIFEAEGRIIVRYDADGSNRTILTNTDSTTTGLFTLGDTLGFSDDYNIATLDKSDGIALSNFHLLLGGNSFAVAPSLDRVFIRSTSAHPVDLQLMNLDQGGNLIDFTDSPYHGGYVGAKRPFIFPDESRVTDDSGIVYSADDLTYINSLGGGFTDLAFNGSSPVILRGDRLTAYGADYLETGSAAVGMVGSRVAINGADAIVFAEDALNSHGMQIRVISLDQLSLAAPGQAIEPRGLSYTPDDAFVDPAGNVLLFSKFQASLFRWSSSGNAYTGSFPLVGTPDYAAYSRETNHAYLAYSDQVIRQMDLGSALPGETPLFNTAAEPNGLTTAGAFVVTSDATRTWDSHYVLGPDGSLIDLVDTNHFSTSWAWDSVKRRLYFFRDDTTPNDLQYEVIDESGLIVSSGETPYHGDFAVKGPIRVSPDGAKVAIGSGVIFETDGLTRLTTLTGGFKDALWKANELLTLHLSGSTSTEVKRWNSQTLNQVDSLPVFSGTPLRILPLEGTRSVLITLDRGRPRFYVLAADDSIESDSVPGAPLVATDGQIVLNEATGLYEQILTIRNVANQAIAGFDLSITGLPPGVELYNGISTGAGSGSLSYRKLLNPGESVQLILEYYASSPGQIPLPAIAATPALLEDQPPGDNGPVFAMGRVSVLPDGVTLEFGTEAGRRYEVQYTDDFVQWKTCPYAMRAAGNKVQWIDRGSPRTDAAPATLPRRFYRIHAVDPE